MTNNKYTVAVVGSGFSGTLVATHLLSTPTKSILRIILAERILLDLRAELPTHNCFRHLLNVPRKNECFVMTTSILFVGQA